MISSVRTYELQWAHVRERLLAALPDNQLDRLIRILEKTETASPDEQDLLREFCMPPTSAFIAYRDRAAS